MNKIIINSPQDMIEFWESLSKKYKKILLEGSLWAWKTHFVKWFAKWIGIDPQIVQSPTYTYLNNYENKLLHIDMYRIPSFEELLEKWILDQIEIFDYIVIERPKRTEEYTDNNWIKIKIEKLDENTRKIILNP